jgi:Endodeoxyribonuclease RusA.
MRYTFNINPQTFVRAVQGDAVFFRIPEVCPHMCDKYLETNFCEHSLYKGGRMRKARLERYNDYKAELSGIAKSQRFSYETSGLSIFFFIPMPVRWPKYKKKIFHMQLHQQKPDLSNLLKAFEDSIMRKDEAIGHYSELGKYWVDVDKGSGWIEITTGNKIYNPKEKYS